MTFENLLETVDCPICDIQEYQVVQKSDYPKNISRKELLRIYKASSDTKLLDQVVKCVGCGLVYLNPRIKSDIIMESYEEAVDPKFTSQNKLRIYLSHKRILNNDFTL